MDSHKFTDDEVAEFKDAFELFDKTGTGIIPYSECANLARCFGYDPLESTVRQLLGGGEETPATKEDMENKNDLRWFEHVQDNQKSVIRWLNNRAG